MNFLTIFFRKEIFLRYDLLGFGNLLVLYAAKIILILQDYASTSARIRIETSSSLINYLRQEVEDCVVLFGHLSVNDDMISSLATNYEKLFVDRNNRCESEIVPNLLGTIFFIRDYHIYESFWISYLLNDKMPLCIQNCFHSYFFHIMSIKKFS